MNGLSRLIILVVFLSSPVLAQTTPPASPRPPISASQDSEYLWCETEDMRGFATQSNGEPVLNPSWLDLPRSKAPGWGMNGTGTSAEWTQGGESGWNSAAASADETVGKIYQDLEIPRAAQYRVWIRYADWANKTENFTVTIIQQGHEVFRHEFGTKDLIDVHDEVSMYWKWAFTWDNATAQLEKGAVAGHDFLMPWNVAPDFWNLYDKLPADRPLYPFNAEPIDQFVEKYKGARDVPIFSSKIVVPVIYINNLPEYLKEGSPFLRYLRDTKSPFAILINYGSAQMSAADGQAVWNLLNGELKDQFIGWISGESVGYVWDNAPAELKVSGSMSRRELLEAYHSFYTNAIARKWAGTFHADTGAMWDKLIPAQATSSTSFAHALTAWGVQTLGIETAAVQPMFAMRTAFTRGAAREYGGNFLYYHAPNFGDTATTFTKAQNFAGPDNFFHSRYGATMGPSLSWYRKSYYFYYMSGAWRSIWSKEAINSSNPAPANMNFS